VALRGRCELGSGGGNALAADHAGVLVESPVGHHYFSGGTVGREGVANRQRQLGL